MKSITYIPTQLTLPCSVLFLITFGPALFCTFPNVKQHKFCMYEKYYLLSLSFYLGFHCRRGALRFFFLKAAFLRGLLWKKSCNRVLLKSSSKTFNFVKPQRHRSNEEARNFRVSPKYFLEAFFGFRRPRFSKIEPRRFFPRKSWTIQKI